MAILQDISYPKVCNLIKEGLRMAYKSFYYLQIPKTGSKYFLNNMYSPLKYELDKHGIEFFNIWDQYSNPLITGWHPKIDKDTYVASTFRDPVKQIVSKYCDQFKSANKSETKYYSNELPDKEAFMQNVNSYANNMSRYLISHSEIYGKNVLQSTEININSAVRRSKRVNKFILESTSPNDTMRSMLQDMDLPVPSYLEKDRVNHKINVNNSSRLLYESLTAEEVEAIRSISDIDEYIYNYAKGLDS